MPERRTLKRDRRRGVRVAATFAVKKTVGARVHLCQAEEIGVAGMTIKRPKDVIYLPRMPVSLCFELPGTREEIAAKGVIVTDATSGRYHRTGVRFISVRPEHQRMIASFCRRSR